MKIKIPFVYNAFVYRTGKRSPIIENLCDHALVEVQDVGLEEAPVAVAWTLGDGKEITEQGEIRLHDGKLFARMRAYDREWDDMRTVGVGELDGLLVSDVSEGDVHMREALDAFLSGGQQIVSSAVKRVERDNRDYVIRKIADGLDDIRIIDGAAWRECDAPVARLLVRRQTDGTLKVDASVLYEKGKREAWEEMYDNDGAEAVFVGLHRSDLLAGVAQRLAPGWETALPEVQANELPEGLADNAFERSVGKEALKYLRKRRSSLGSCDEDAIIAWAMLSKAANRLAAATTEGPVDAGLVSAVFERWSEHAELANDRMPAIAGVLREIWESRAVDLDDVLGQAMEIRGTVI
jgi:hypothetical protein